MSLDDDDDDGLLISQVGRVPCGRGEVCLPKSCSFVLILLSAWQTVGEDGSAGETVLTTAMHQMWSDYEAGVNGTTSLATFRAYLASAGLAASPGTGAPTATEGMDVTATLGLPVMGLARA